MSVGNSSRPTSLHPFNGWSRAVPKGMQKAESSYDPFPGRRKARRPKRKSSRK